MRAQQCSLCSYPRVIKPNSKFPNHNKIPRIAIILQVIRLLDLGGAANETVMLDGDVATGSRLPLTLKGKRDLDAHVRTCADTE